MREAHGVARVGERRSGDQEPETPAARARAITSGSASVRGHLEVAVQSASDRSSPRLVTYFTMLPGGTSAGTSRSDGSPVSPTVAASTIPFDSTPMSLAGFRFATITTTFLPTSASGS